MSAHDSHDRGAPMGASADCRAFRADVLRGDGAGSDLHAQGCAPCRRFAWLQSQIVSSLAEPQVAPEALELRVALELEEPGLRFVRAFERSAPHPAPAALDHAVRRQLESGSDEPRRASAGATQDAEASLALHEEGAVARGLADLPDLSAPAVLDRLVSEELARPASTQTERYFGGLSPLSAPDVLTARLSSGPVSGAGGRRRRPRLLARAAAPAALAAAALFALVLLPQFESVGGASGLPKTVSNDRWTFRVVEVQPGEMSPQSAAFLGVLSGGKSSGRSASGDPFGGSAR